jgi:hypothetical protein
MDMITIMLNLGFYVNPENAAENDYNIPTDDMEVYKAKYEAHKDQLTVFLWPCKLPLGTPFK